VWEKLSKLPDREAMARWADEHSRFFYPDGSQQLALDEDLVALNVAFDQSEFFDRVLADLRTMDMAAKFLRVAPARPRRSRPAAPTSLYFRPFASNLSSSVQRGVLTSGRIVAYHDDAWHPG
jgi:hypothetical protein